MMSRDSSAERSLHSATIPSVQRRTITEEVLVHLRDLLLRGVLKSGSRIDQAELANSFGVSTVPVREALLRLQSAGLVEVVPHRGVFVSEVSVEELLDIYTTRELLEEQAARLAAENLTAESIAELEDIAASMETAATKKRLDDLPALNREFHFIIYRAAHRRHLLHLIEHLWDLSTRYAHLQLHTVPDRATEALYEVRSIISACETKDADALGWMIRYKVHQTTAGLLRHMSLPDTGVLGEALGKPGAARHSSKKATHGSEETRGKSVKKATRSKKKPSSQVAKKATSSAKNKLPTARSTGRKAKRAAGRET